MEQTYKQTSVKTYKEIDQFRRIAEIRLQTSDPQKETKLNACIEELIGNPRTGDLGTFYTIGLEYQKKIKQIYRKHAGVDKEGFIIKDANNNYVFTKEAEELVEKEIEVLQTSSVEFTPAYCPAKDWPQQLLPSELIIYKGFVIE